MHRIPRLAVLLLAAALLLGAGSCGKDDPAQELTVVGTEMAFEAPATTPPGEYVVRFENRGALFHELAVKDARGQVLRRVTAGPGQTGKMALSLAAGRYELGCFEPGHYEGGMHRPLTVG